ncbi:unnamed protein product [Sphagnum balticum]
MRAEATELASTPFVGTLVTTVGVCYSEFARRKLDPVDSVGLRFYPDWSKHRLPLQHRDQRHPAAYTASSMNQLQKKHQASHSAKTDADATTTQNAKTTESESSSAKKDPPERATPQLA